MCRGYLFTVRRRTVASRVVDKSRRAAIDNSTAHFLKRNTITFRRGVKRLISQNQVMLFVCNPLCLCLHRKSSEYYFCQRMCPYINRFILSTNPAYIRGYAQYYLVLLETRLSWRNKPKKIRRSFPRDLPLLAYSISNYCTYTRKCGAHKLIFMNRSQILNFYCMCWCSLNGYHQILGITRELEAYVTDLTSNK